MEKRLWKSEAIQNPHDSREPLLRETPTTALPHPFSRAPSAFAAAERLVTVLELLSSPFHRASWREKENQAGQGCAVGAAAGGAGARPLLRAGRAARRPRAGALIAGLLPFPPSLPSFLGSPAPARCSGDCRHGPRRCAAAAAAAVGGAAGGGGGRPRGAQPAGELAAPQRERLGVAPSGGAGLRSHRAAPPGPHPGTVLGEPGPGALPALGSPPRRGEHSPTTHSSVPVAAGVVGIPGAASFGGCSVLSPAQGRGYQWMLCSM